MFAYIANILSKNGGPKKGPAVLLPLVPPCLEVEPEAKLYLPVRSESDRSADGRTKQAECGARGSLRKRLSGLYNRG